MRTRVFQARLVELTTRAAAQRGRYKPLTDVVERGTHTVGGDYKVGLERKQHRCWGGELGAWLASMVQTRIARQAGTHTVVRQLHGLDLDGLANVALARGWYGSLSE